MALKISKTTKNEAKHEICANRDYVKSRLFKSVIEEGMWTIWLFLKEQKRES